MSFKIGVVGATGMVGEAFMQLLERKNVKLDELRPFASERSLGTNIRLLGISWPVQTLKPGCFGGLDVVFFSSGDDISKEWAPKAVDDGAFAIDNSAAYRMDSRYPLIVPEVNGHLLPDRSKPTIIANPNCSTIQLVVALEALRPFGLKEVRVATYQSVSGAGKAGREELLAQVSRHGESGEVRALAEEKTFPHPIAYNCVPQIGSFNNDGYCSEEMKIMNETRKILSLPDLRVSAFTVRVPSLNSHSEAVWVTFEKSPSKDDVLSALENGKGLKLYAQTEPTRYPTALDATGTEPVLVGRVHQDLYDPRTWMMWVVADNIWKGAALNGLQIAEKLFGQLN